MQKYCKACWQWLQMITALPMCPLDRTYFVLNAVDLQVVLHGVTILPMSAAGRLLYWRFSQYGLAVNMYFER